MVPASALANHSNQVAMADAKDAQNRLSRDADDEFFDNSNRKEDHEALGCCSGFMYVCLILSLIGAIVGPIIHIVAANSDGYDYNTDATMWMPCTFPPLFAVTYIIYLIHSCCCTTTAAYTSNVMTRPEFDAYIRDVRAGRNDKRGF